MNMATESPVSITVSSRTSTNLNSRPADADPKTSSAIAGMKPACVIKTPKAISERGRTINARVEQRTVIVSAVRSPMIIT